MRDSSLGGGFSEQRASIVCGSSTYEMRAAMVKDYLLSQGYKVQVIVPDWDHIKKRYRTVDPEFTSVHVMSYGKNISFRRIVSYKGFSRQAVSVVEGYNPDVVYVLLPSNFLARDFARYKVDHAGTKLVFDVLDMWPEAFPYGVLEKTPLGCCWRRMRDDSLPHGDLVFTECNLFGRMLNNNGVPTRCETLYYAKKSTYFNVSSELDEDEYFLCYLGSINNIIDIPGIVDAILGLPRQSTVEIIGDGEKREEFIRTLNDAGIKTIYHGRVFDAEVKNDIMSRCHFGLNIMKGNVLVGLSMKSVDYFENGLPIINGLRGDTRELVEERLIGVNVDKLPQLSAAELDDISRNREGARSAFDELFSGAAFVSSLDKYLKPILIR